MDLSYLKKLFLQPGHSSHGAHRNSSGQENPDQVTATLVHGLHFVKMKRCVFSFLGIIGSFCFDQR